MRTSCEGIVAKGFGTARSVAGASEARVSNHANMVMGQRAMRQRPERCAAPRWETG